MNTFIFAGAMIWKKIAETTGKTLTNSYVTAVTLRKGVKSLSR